MARLPASQQEILNLGHRLDQARAGLGIKVAALRRRLDVPARVGASLRRHPAAWFFGSLATGWLASRALHHRRKPAAPAPLVSRRRTAVAAAVGLAVSLAKPVLRRWLWRKIAGRF